MIICLCHRISDRDIRRAARDGCPSFDALQEETRVGTGCGACLDHAREAFEKNQARPACGQTGRVENAVRAVGSTDAARILIAVSGPSARLGSSSR
jgi:bacterioferritin-associated ferredoxin